MKFVRLTILFYFFQSINSRFGIKIRRNAARAGGRVQTHCDFPRWIRDMTESKEEAGGAWRAAEGARWGFGGGWEVIATGSPGTEDTQTHQPGADGRP